MAGRLTRKRSTRSSKRAATLAPLDILECGRPDPLGVILEEHALQLELCDLLEAIADSLPLDVQRPLAKVALNILTSTWPAHVRFEEDCLFKILRHRMGSDPEGQELLIQLEAEHDHDEGNVCELSEGLSEIAEHGVVKDPQMLGYMLRGFFESQRRHIYWENATVLPLAHKLLTAADKIQMQDWIMSSGHPWCRQKNLLQLREAAASGSACGGCSHLNKAKSERRGG